jgi:hypothetical protein
MANTEQVFTRVSPEVAEALKRLAAAEQRSVAWIVRSILLNDRGVLEYLDGQ